MLLITNLNEIPPLEQTCGFTIGTFDGVHRGHQELIKHLRAKIPSKSKIAAFTFSNHPSHLFSPHSPLPLICSPLQKVKFLADIGVEIVFLIPFTKEFSQISFESFLKSMKRHLGFSHLTLGAGATFGKNKEGDEAKVKALAKDLSFEVDYLQKFLINGTPVSSGRIRTLISQANFTEAHQCLGRPYSLLGSLFQKKKHFHMYFPGICLPPQGIFPVQLKTHSQVFIGKARISLQEQQITIELPENRLPMSGQDAELIFNF
jgi:riboflavin kinase/FMN adenylyltransferase